MTVAELIAALRKLNQHAEVMLIVRNDAAGWLDRVEYDPGSRTADLRATTRKQGDR